jgi:hypothetical protein
MTLLLLPSFSRFMLLRLEEKLHHFLSLLLSLYYDYTCYFSLFLRPSFFFSPSLLNPLFLHSSLSQSLTPPSNSFTYLFSFLLFKFHTKVRGLQPPLTHAKNAVRTIRRYFEEMFPLLKLRSIFLLKISSNISYLFFIIIFYYYH